MRVCVIDGRGGGLGKRLVEELVNRVGSAHEILAIGTNRAATETMARAGATCSGTGERCIIEMAPKADVILASLNLVLPGTMLGEVTPGIARAVLRAPGRKLLLPINRMQVEIVGTEVLALEYLIVHAACRVQTLLGTSVSV